MKTKSEIKKIFEANMLDGDKVEDCGGAMLSAESVLDFIYELLATKETKSKKEECKHNWLEREGELGKYCPKCHGIKSGGKLIITPPTPPVLEDKKKEFNKLFVKGHPPISSGANDVQEAESWIEAEPEELWSWIITNFNPNQPIERVSEDKKAFAGGHSNGKSTYVKNMKRILEDKTAEGEIEPIEKMVLEIYADDPILYELHKKQCEIIDRLNSLSSNAKTK